MAYDPYRLALAVKLNDGRTVRWGPDELDPANTPTGLVITTSVPGGYRTLDCTLLRRIDLDYPDQDVLGSATLYGPGGDTKWDGYLTQFPRDHGDRFTVTPGGLGWASTMRWRQPVELIVDRDLSKWDGPSLTRQTTLAAGGYGQPQGPQVTRDVTSGNPAVTLRVGGSWVSGQSPVAEAIYRGVAVIGAIYHDVSFTPADANWTVTVGVWSDDAGTAQNNSSDLQAGGSPGYHSPVTTYTCGALQLYYALATAGGSAGADYPANFRKLAVYGNHGLTRRGSDPGGFYTSDIIQYVVNRWCPNLTAVLGAGGIETVSFIVPHCVLDGSKNTEDVVLDLNNFHRYEWGVYDDRAFFWRPRDPSRLTWRLRLDDGVKLKADGATGEETFNGVIVTFTDPTGETYTVGPSGSGAMFTDSTLVDTSLSNPVNQRNLGPKYKQLQVQQVTTLAAATQIGYAWLLEQAEPKKTGTAVAYNLAEHPSGAKRPVVDIRAGDFIQITDSFGDNIGGERYVIETRYEHDSRSNTLTLDNSVGRVEGILERLGVTAYGAL